MAGSRRRSANDAVPLLPGGLPPPAIKLLTAAFLLYSSSTSRLLRLRIRREIPPAIAPMAVSPTTTPAAIPALLGLLELEDPVDEVEFDVDVGVDVTTTVCPTVTTGGFPLLEGIADAEDWEDEL